MSSTYGGGKQRWLIVHSEHAYTREMKTFEKTLEKERSRHEKDLWHLSNQQFACEADAVSAAMKFAKKLRHQQLDYVVLPKHRYTGKGRPARDAVPETVDWYIQGSLTDHKEAIEQSTQRKGKFVLATNELNLPFYPMRNCWKYTRTKE